jgi:hypothetical protein
MFRGMRVTSGKVTILKDTGNLIGQTPHCCSEKQKIDIHCNIAVFITIREDIKQNIT